MCLIKNKAGARALDVTRPAGLHRNSALITSRCLYALFGSYGALSRPLPSFNEKFKED